MVQEYREEGSLKDLIYQVCSKVGGQHRKEAGRGEEQRRRGSRKGNGSGEGLREGGRVEGAREVIL